MKIKQFLFITDKVAFAEGRYNHCFNVFGTPNCPDNWQLLGEIEIDCHVEADNCGCDELAIEICDEAARLFAKSRIKQ